MSDFITLPLTFERAPPPFEGNDIKSPESLARYVVDRYSKPGDRVLDPFAGLGTFLFVAEAMGRVPFGIEADRQRQQWVAGQMEHWQNHIWGDASQLDNYGMPKMDLILTCPPFMKKRDRWNPLFNGDPDHAGYDAYLAQLGKIFALFPKLLKRGGHAVIQLDNLPGQSFTPLVRDAGALAARSLRPVGEVVIAWDNPRPDYSHTNCLIFKNA